MSYKLGICGTSALVGGYFITGAYCGAFYFYLAYSFSNRNWNIAASHSYTFALLMCHLFRAPWQK